MLGLSLANRQVSVKVLQIDPPESEEEHPSLDSKDEKSPLKKITSMMMQLVMDGPLSPPSKEHRSNDTP